MAFGKDFFRMGLDNLGMRYTIAMCILESGHFDIIRTGWLFGWLV